MNAIETQPREGYGITWNGNLDHTSPHAFSVAADLLTGMAKDGSTGPPRPLRSETDLLDWLCGAAKTLEFEYCTIGMRFPLPLTRPHVVILGNHPERWGQWYVQKAFESSANGGWAEPDLPAAHVEGGAQCRSVEELWDAACSFDGRNGLTHSHRDSLGIASRLTLGRTNRPLRTDERHAKESAMRILSARAHDLLLHTVRSRLAREMPSALTVREVEVLRWAADGKTGKDIGLILDISLATVRFHLKSVMRKLGAANVSAAIARALMLDLLQGAEQAAFIEAREIPVR